MSEPPNTARCCSEHDPATAWLTSEWPETFTLQVAHCRNVVKGPSIRPLGQSIEQGTELCSIVQMELASLEICATLFLKWRETEVRARLRLHPRDERIKVI